MGENHAKCPIEKHREWKKRMRNKRGKMECKRQFPDCPEVSDLKEDLCRTCPFNLELKRIQREEELKNNPEDDDDGWC